MAEVSIIVPVYKAESYIHDCIGSILSQTYSDFELLLVDDGSPDNCLAICRDYAARDPRIRVFHQENQGQSAARNFALTQATGNWICYVDSDDTIHHQMLELLWKAVQESGAAISQCQMLEAIAQPGDFERQRSGDYSLYPMDEKNLVELFDRGEYPGWVACAKLIRRDLIESYPFTQGRVYEDNEAVCRWVCRAGKIAAMAEDMYFYRGNPDSTTQKAFSRKRLDYLWALESIIGFFGELGYKTLQQRFCGLYAETAAGFHRNCMAQDWRQDAKRIRKAARKMFLFDRIPLTKGQLEMMLDAFYPKWMGIYWILEAVWRRLPGKGA